MVQIQSSENCTYITNIGTVNRIEKTNIKKKEAGIGPIKKDEFERIEFNPRIYKILFSMVARMSQQHVPFAVLV